MTHALVMAKELRFWENQNSQKNGPLGYFEPNGRHWLGRPILVFLSIYG